MIESLPAELFTLITRYLAASDFGHLRVTSSKLAAILTPVFKLRYFTRVSAKLHSYWLHRLPKILGSHLNNIQALTIQGGLINGKQIRVEYYNLLENTDNGWSRLERRVLSYMAACENRNNHVRVHLLAQALGKFPRKRIKRLIVDKPSASSLTFSTEEVRRTIGWKSLAVTLQALVESRTTVESFKAIGFTCPPDIDEYMSPGLNVPFRHTKSLELELISIASPDKLAWVTEFLRCFTNVEEAKLCISAPWGTWHDRQAFALAISKGLHSKPMKKLIVGSGTGGIQSLLQYLEDRHLNEELERFRWHVDSANIGEALMQEPALKLEDIKLQQSEDITFSFAHEACCRRFIELAHLERELAALLKHVRDYESLGGGGYVW